MEAFIVLDGLQSVKGERRTMLPLPDEILHWHDLVNSVISSGKAVTETVLALGRGVTLKEPKGPPGYANLLARIPEYEYYYWVDFAK